MLFFPLTCTACRQHWVASPDRDSSVGAVDRVEQRQISEGWERFSGDGGEWI